METTQITEEIEVQNSLKKIELINFYNPYNVTIYLLISIFSSLILAPTVVPPFSLPAIPFYFFSIVCLALLFSSTLKILELDFIFTVKIILDTLLTIYWIDLHLWRTGITLFYFLPNVTLLTLVIFNLQYGKRRFYHFVIYAVVLANGVVYQAIAGFTASSPMSLGVYYLITFLSIWAHLSHIRLRMLLQQDLSSKKKRIDRLVSSSKTFSLAARIVNHEVSNELVRISYCEHKLKSENPDRHIPRILDELKHCRDAIPRYLQMMSEEKGPPVSLAAVCRTVFPEKHANVSFLFDVVVRVPMMLLVSFINNIYENALQAYERRNGTLDGFRMEVSMNDATLSIEDNAGGFDISGIALGKSRKGPGHGLFLATFLNDTGHLGLTPAIERMENGTRVTITFSEIEKVKEPSPQQDTGTNSRQPASVLPG